MRSIIKLRSGRVTTAFASGSFSISPPSGNYVSTQAFDVVLLVNALGRTIVDTRATLDGADVTAALAHCVIAGTLLTGGVTARCPGVEGASFVPGTHTRCTSAGSGCCASSVSRMWRVSAGDFIAEGSRQ